jgi:mono/diheme cytochrome c family protein
MKALKVSFVISAVVLFSVACASNNANNSNGGANANSSTASSSPTQNGNATAGGTGVNANAASGANANATAMTTSNSVSGVPGTDAAALFNGGVTPKCSGCHGEDGKGKMKGTPDFTSRAWQDKRSNDDIIGSIIEGRGEGATKMPAFRSKLSDEQIKALLRYVRSFGNK